MIKDIKKRALHRSKILQGQLRGLEKMIDNEEYCLDIITQSLAIQKSLSSLDKLILENHIRTHIAETVSKNDQKRVVEELLNLYEIANIRASK